MNYIKIATSIKVVFITLILLIFSNNITQANAQNTLIVYTAHPLNLAEAVFNKFTEKTGIKVQFLHMGSGDVLSRVRAEKSNPQADAIFGAPSYMAVELANENLLEKFNPKWTNEIEDKYKDPSGYWYGTQLTPQVIFYNNRNLKKDQAPVNWSDLADKRFKNQIILRDPLTSGTMQAFFSGFMYQSYKKTGSIQGAFPFLISVMHNVKKNVNESTLMFRAIAQGSAQIGIWNFSGAYDNIQKNKFPQSIVITKDETPTNIDIVAIIKNAKNLENAKKFIDFVGEREMQIYQAKNFARIPTMGSISDELPQWMQKHFNIMEIDWNVIAEHRIEWFKELQAAAKKQ